MKNFLVRLIAVIIGFSVAFGLAEIAVRIISPQETGPPRFAFNSELGEIPVPHQKGRRHYPGVYDFSYSNNSLGFRGSREFGPKKPGEVRLLLLGDSFTYGLGVNDDQTFASQIEQYLRKNNLPAEVINGGNPGKGTDYELKFFQTLGAKLQPEVTVLFFFPAMASRPRGEYYDLQPDGGLKAKSLDGAQDGIKTFLCHVPGYSWLISWSQAANLVKQAAVNFLMKAGPGGAGAAAYGFQGSYDNDGLGFVTEGSRKLTDVYLARLKDAVNQAGSEFVVFYVPLAAEVEAHRREPEFSRDEKAIKEIIEARGGTLQSLTPLLAAAPEPVGELYYAEGHWTPRAHLLAGRYLGGYLAGLLQAKR